MATGDLFGASRPGPFGGVSPVSVRAAPSLRFAEFLSTRVDPDFRGGERGIGLAVAAALTDPGGVPYAMASGGFTVDYLCVLHRHLFGGILRDGCAGVFRSDVAPDPLNPLGPQGVSPGRVSSSLETLISVYFPDGVPAALEPLSGGVEGILADRLAVIAAEITRIGPFSEGNRQVAMLLCVAFAGELGYRLDFARMTDRELASVAENVNLAALGHGVSRDRLSNLFRRHLVLERDHRLSVSRDSVERGGGPGLVWEVSS